MTLGRNYGTAGLSCNHGIWRLKLAASTLLVSAIALAQHAFADAVFDGSIGPNPAGTVRSGLFEISEADGSVAGNNIFHSFSAFNILQGELATFSHESANISSIIARVSGDSASEIHGGLQVRQLNNATLVPTDASLWLINPSGIVIGDGASFDPLSTVLLSTANRVGFANGDSFYSHEPVLSSVLSIAEPSAFGFLDKQDLPATVAARGIRVSLADTGNNNLPLLLPNVTLVGSSLDATMPGVLLSGDIAGPLAATAASAPIDSSPIQAIQLGLGALAPGGSMFVSGAGPNPLSAEPGTPLGGILVRNTNLVASDFGIGDSANLSVLADQLRIDNSYIEAYSLDQSVAVSLRAISDISFIDTVLYSSTDGAVDGGDVRVDTRHYTQSRGQVTSRNLDFTAPTGEPGNLIFGSSASLPMQTFTLGDGMIQSFSTGPRGGDILINVRDKLQLSGRVEGGAGISNINSGNGTSGDILLVGDTIASESTQIFSAGLNPGDDRFISLQAGDGGLEMVNSTILASSSSGRSGATVSLASTGDLSLVSDGERSLVATGTSSTLDGGDIFIAADGNLFLQGNMDLSNTSSDDVPDVGDAGAVSLSGRNIELIQVDSGQAGFGISSTALGAGASGPIVMMAAEDLLIRGQHDLSSRTLGTGNSGAVILQGNRIRIESSEPASLSTSSLGAGDAGIISLAALDSLDIAGAAIDSVAADQGAAGFVLLSAGSVQIQDTTLATATRANDSADTPAQIGITATENLSISESRLQSNATGLSPAGQVLLSAGNNLAVNNVSVQTATLGEGVTGSILLLSGGDLELAGSATELLSNSIGASDAGDVSAVAGGTLFFRDGGFIQTSATGSGNAGRILLSADKVRLSLARIEGTSENAGGGDVGIFGRDIQLDGDLDAGGIVFITADSQASDAAGNGGSITLGNPMAPAELILVRNSGLLANANAGNGGRININAEEFLRDARSTFQVSSNLGDQGVLEINAPEQDISAAVAELEVAILDATDLIRDQCAVDPDDASSLVIAADAVTTEQYDTYLTGAVRLGRGSASLGDVLPPTDGGNGQLLLARRPGANCLQVTQP